MNEQPILRDERTTAVENQSYRLAYQVIAYGLLAIVAYRGFFRQESSWDLLGLVILSSGIATLYQGRQKIFTRRSIWMMAVSAVAAAVLAVVLVLLLR